MNKILVQTLEPGKYFNRQVFLDDKYILLSPDTPINEQMINRLRNWGFTYVQTDGESVDSPLTSFSADGGEEDTQLANLDTDIKDQENLKRAKRAFQETLDYTEKAFTNFVTKNELPIRPITENVKDLMEKVRSYKKYILRLTELSDPDRNYIVTHSVKTTILSIAIGITLRLPPHKQIELGLCSLLHEIGMIRLPPQLYMSENSLTEKERKAITAHPVIGFKILKQYSFPMPVCLGVLESHENLDGSGYPRNLAGEKISLYAKIINVCGSYAALISKRPYRSARDGHNSILDLLKQRGKQYDESVLRALVKNLSIFPIGTYVLLSNGSMALVTESDAENPRAPVVQIVATADGDRLTEYPIVKTNNNTYSIVRPLAKQEVENISLEA